LSLQSLPLFNVCESGRLESNQSLCVVPNHTALLVLPPDCLLLT